MRKSLYGKLIFFTVTVMITSGAIAFLIVNTFYHQKLKAQNDEKNMKIVQHIAHYIEENDDLLLADYLSTVANTGYKIIVVNEIGNITYHGEDFREHNLANDVIKRVLSGEQYHGMRDFPKETFVTGFFADETANTVGTSFTYENQTYALFLRPNIKLLFTEIHYLLGGMFLVMGVISIIGMLFLASRLIKPIITLKKATKKVGAAQFSVSLPTERSDEIGQLAQSFQTMTEQLDASDQMRKQFINDVSHDFQTPLQNIQGYAHLLEDTSISKADKHMYIDIIQKETTRLSNLTNQLLLLTSLDAITQLLQPKEIDITKQIQSIIQKYRWKMNEKNISVITHLEESKLIGDESYLEQLWDNLLSNALKYSVQDGLIELTLIDLEQHVQFQLQDSGIGIHEKNIPLLFNRFYRADDSRNKDIPGTGLGLSIVQQIIHLHGGKIHVESTINKGTTFTVTLPKK